MKFAVIIRPNDKPDIDLDAIIVPETEFGESSACHTAWHRFAQSYAPPGVTVPSPSDLWVSSCIKAGYRVEIFNSIELEQSK